jgi:hypothetical protein
MFQFIKDERKIIMSVAIKGAITGAIMAPLFYIGQRMVNEATRNV